MNRVQSRDQDRAYPGSRGASRCEGPGCVSDADAAGLACTRASVRVPGGPPALHLHCETPRTASAPSPAHCACPPTAHRRTRHALARVLPDHATSWHVTRATTPCRCSAEPARATPGPGSRPARKADWAARRAALHMHGWQGTAGPAGPRREAAWRGSRVRPRAGHRAARLSHGSWAGNPAGSREAPHAPAGTVEPGQAHPRYTPPKRPCRRPRAPLPDWP